MTRTLRVGLALIVGAGVLIVAVLWLARSVDAPEALVAPQGVAPKPEIPAPSKPDGAVATSVPDKVGGSPPTPSVVGAGVVAYAFRARVVDAAGSVVQGAQVELRPVAGDGYIGKELPRGGRTETTGPDGTCVFKVVPGAPTYLISASLGDTCALVGPRPRQELEGGVEVELRLVSAIRVTGVVQSTGGKGIGGARLKLRLDWSRLSLPCDLSTSPDGTFALMPLPRSWVGNTFTIVAKAPGFGEHTEYYTADELAEDSVVVVLGEGREFRGRCVGADGTPVANVSVLPCGPPGSAVTDASGAFSLRVRDESVSSLVFILNRRTLFRKDGLGRSGDSVVDVGDVVLSPGRLVSGVVTRGGGTPIPGAVVVLQYAALPEMPPRDDPTLLPGEIVSVAGAVHTLSEATTGDDGAFRLEDVGDVPHCIEVWPPGSDRSPGATCLLRREGIVGGTVDLRLIVGGGSIRLKFDDASTGKGLSVAKSVLVSFWPSGQEEKSRGEFFVEVGPDGVTVEIGKAGKYDLEVEAEGFVVERREGVFVKDDDAVEIVVALARQ